MGKTLRMRRRDARVGWLGMELSAVATLVTVAWINEPGSLERFGLMCACWAPIVLGAALRACGQSRSHG